MTFGFSRFSCRKHQPINFDSMQCGRESWSHSRLSSKTSREREFSGMGFEYFSPTNPNVADQDAGFPTVNTPTICPCFPSVNEGHSIPYAQEIGHGRCL